MGEFIILSATIGRIVPKYRTLGEWAEIYVPLLAERQISTKTLNNRMHHVRRIVKALGGRSIGSIRPHEISTLIAEVTKEHPGTAKRVLIEIHLISVRPAGDWWTCQCCAPANEFVAFSNKIRRITRQHQRFTGYHPPTLRGARTCALRWLIWQPNPST